MASSKKYPKISIVTPSFNQGQFIEKTIKSVLEQDYPNIEYIVMDGGSTDKTVSILKKYSNKIKWVSEKDKGQAHAINKGLKRATGDILAYINSDDYYLPGAFKKVYEFFEKNKKYKWVTADTKIVDEKGKEMQGLVRIYKSIYRRFSSENVLKVLNFIPQPSTFWKREVYKSVGSFNESLRYVMDYEYWLRTFKKYPLGEIKDELSAFRIHSQSKGGVDYKKQFAEELKIAKRFTRSPLLRSLHAFHNFLIIWAYNIIKK